VTVIDSEQRVLELLRPQYEALGYLFIERPSGEALPAALEGFRPDAIAIGPQKKIAIEIKLRRDRSSPGQLQALSERLRKHPDWELRVIYGDFDGGDDLDLQNEPSTAVPRIEMEKQIDEAEALSRAGHHRAALILVWAALEAIARTATLGETVGRGVRAPRQVLEILERMGRLTFEDADQLRNALTLRNAAVHGDYQTDVTSADVALAIRAARTALEATEERSLG
jgi:uncharacterized protein YutE (UPF0331/DUF86 family)